MNDEQKNGRAKPPYVAYPSFTAFIDSFADKPVPPRIDKSLMSKYAGSVQSQLMLTMKYLGLIAEDGTVHDQLRQLISARGTPNWADLLRDSITQHYIDIIDGLDIRTATMSQLVEKFRDRGNVVGSICDKAVRFYLAAAEDAGIETSAYFKVRRAAPSRPKSPRGRRTAPAVVTPKVNDAEDDNAFIIPIFLRGKKPGKIVMPEGFDQNDLAMVDAAVAMLKVYAKQGSEGDQ